MKHAVSEDMVGTECTDSLSRLENLCSYKDHFLGVLHAS